MLPDTLDSAPVAPPTVAHLRPAEVVFSPGAPGGTLTVAPEFADAFASVGLRTAAAFLDLPGEVVSGHADRHVARVIIPGCGRAFYLKRQHVVGWREQWRSWRAGFGWVSRCEREAAVLQRLQAAGLPAPRWAAFGFLDGRAFLLVEEADAVDLRALLAGGLPVPERRQLAANIGRAVAAVHAAGITTPDLTAKHVLVNPESLAVTFLDWPSSELRPVTDADRADALGALHASLAGGVASRADRARVLLAFTSPIEGEVAIASSQSRVGGGHRRDPEVSNSACVALTHSTCASPPTRRRSAADLPLKGGGQKHLRAELLRPILRAAERHSGRRSVRDQLQPAGAEPQRLVWLAGEAVCAVPEAAAVWPRPAVCPPFYTDEALDGPVSVRFAGRDAVLVRGRSFAPLGRLRAWFRAAPWRSPGVTAGRVLFHLRRYGVPAPGLLAFGQRLTTAVGAEWFVLYDAPPGAPLRRWRRNACLTERRRLLAALGACLDKLHAAGCVLADVRTAFATDGERVSVADPLAVRIVRRVTDAARERDRRALAGFMGVE